jgi:hypothetical protein
MKKKYIVFGLLAASSLYTFAQKSESNNHRKKVSQTSIQLVYSHYLQNGNHSAVTGGTGTERLTIYSPDITIKKQVDSFRSFSVNTGVDIISSASTDNIDFVMSSASRIDHHAYVNAEYNRDARNKRWGYGVNGYFSIESDYLSAGAGISGNISNADHSREFSASFEFFLDDLRWGRLNGERPLRLVYPDELRGTDWFDNYKRQSYNLNLGIRQIINKKIVLAVFPGIAYQHGLLGTPFHRVFFKDSSVQVERLPGNRVKVPLGIQLNSFLGNKYVLNSYYRFYWDNFGIAAHTIELECNYKATPVIVLAPFIRFYTQQAANFFKPFAEHEISEEFYTSDYDLSAFESYEGGIELRLNSTGRKKRFVLEELGLRYSYYKRSDGLHAHTITLLSQVQFLRKQR